MKPLEMREADFKKSLKAFVAIYPADLIAAFEEYWTEPNKSGTKMKFEMEKTWDTRRRIARWANNGFGNDKKATPKVVKVENKSPANDFEVLDKFLSEYVRRPSEIPFDAFGKWYEFMKAHRLLKPFSKEEVETLQLVYNGNKEKCRCACVQKTFDGYVNTGMTVGDIIKMRERLNEPV